MSKWQGLHDDPLSINTQVGAMHSHVAVAHVNVAGNAEADLDLNSPRSPEPLVTTSTSSSSSSSSSSKEVHNSATTGLWNHDSNPQPKWKILGCIFIVLIGYGIAMFANGAASKFLTPRYLTSQQKSSSPIDNYLTGVGLAVVGSDPVFLLSSFRVIATILLLIGMFTFGSVPDDMKHITWRQVLFPSRKLPHVTSSNSNENNNNNTTVTTISTIVPTAAAIQFPTARQALVPIAIGATNALGYMPYMVLCSLKGGGVALWAAMVGLYVITPVSYGIFMRGEARTNKKLAGIAACIVAGVLLGLPEDLQESGGGTAAEDDMHTGAIASGWTKLALFIGCIGLWGACDGMVAFVGRDMHPFWVAAFTAVGFCVSALVSSWVSFIAIAVSGPMVSIHSAAYVGGSSNGGGGGHDENRSVVGTGGALGYFLLFGAQCLGIAAWFASVKLGQMSEASAFLPITSLYTVLTSIGGVVILGESLPPTGWVGVVLAAIGMVVIGNS